MSSVGSEGQKHPAATIVSFSERLTSNLQNSERLLSELRELAEKEDDGNIKFLGPLEDTFQSLHELYESLSEYAIFLQRTGRRMSQVSTGVGNLLSPHAPSERYAGSIDEFFDAEEIIIAEVSDEDDDDFYASREVASVATSEITSDLSESMETILPPLPSAAMVSSIMGATALGFRRRLPKQAPPCNISVSNILRKSIGKDWSSIPMPVALNEPLSALQRLCEELEYSDLLDAAAKCTSSIDRMIHVAAFAVSGYANSVHRVERKPFTPILGETFEYERMDKGYRFLAEKVSHRPLIIAMHADSERWSFWQDQRIKDKFWGKSMEYTPMGRVHVYFPDTGDHFVWRKVVTCVRNILMGNKWVEHYGDMVMKNVRTGDTATIVFKSNSTGFFSSSNAITNEVYATITPSRSGPESTRSPVNLRGRWDSMLCEECPNGETKLIWQAAPVPNDHLEYFSFAEFAISLNDLPGWLKPHLPHTDSRMRPDQRLLEEGRLDEAEALKQQIEQRQRDYRAELERDGERWEPAWFAFDPPTKEDPDGTWKIKSPTTYWECRQGKKWPELRPLW